MTALPERKSKASPDDIREQGWLVACHYDYELEGEFQTFWMFTKDGKALVGRGTSDGEALEEVRQQLLSLAISELTSEAQKHDLGYGE